MAQEIKRRLVGRFNVYTPGEQYLGDLLVYKVGEQLVIMADEALRVEFEKRYGLDPVSTAISVLLLPPSHSS